MKKELIQSFAENFESYNQIVLPMSGKRCQGFNRVEFYTFHTYRIQ